MVEVGNILRNNKKICNFKSNTGLVFRLLVMHLYHFMNNGGSKNASISIGGYSNLIFMGEKIRIKFHKVL